MECRSHIAHKINRAELMKLQTQLYSIFNSTPFVHLFQEIGFYLFWIINALFYIDLILNTFNSCHFRGFEKYEYFSIAFIKKIRTLYCG